MFILDLTYQKSLDEVNAQLPYHNQYLEKYYASGNFLCSGRKNPRVGGIILAVFDSLDQANSVIHEDPFYQHGIAEYKITEFIPTKKSDAFPALD